MGHKGGQSSTEIKIPKALEDASKEQLALAKKVGALGFQPWQGPTVAAFTPQQTSAFRNTAQAADAFGLSNPGGSGIGAAAGLPKPQTFAGGIRGYSAMPLYNQSIDKLPDSFVSALRAILGGGGGAPAPQQQRQQQQMYYDPQTGQMVPAMRTGGIK